MRDCQLRPLWLHEDMNRPILHINISRHALGLCALIATCFAQGAFAQDGPTPFDLRHEACLDKISDDAEQAYESALTWQDEGGGWRAQHCVAMSLFGLGRTNMAAYRLEQLGRAPHSVTDSQKADYFYEASNFWLLDEDYERAKNASSAGLELRAEHLDLLISRARAHAGLKDYAAAQKDLDRVLKLAPTRADAYRYRADLHRKNDKLDAALRDIEKSLALDGTQVETAILRGHIREDLRKVERAQIEAGLNIGAPKRPDTDESGVLVIPPFIDDRPKK